MSQFKLPFNQEPSQQLQSPQWIQPQFYEQIQPALPSSSAIRPPQEKSAIQRRERRETIIAVSILLAMIAAIVLAGVIYEAVSGNSSSSSSTSTGTSSSVATWTTTHTFSGNGIKKTEIFTVPDDWKIVWTCDPGSFQNIQYNVQVSVYSSNNSFVDLAVNTLCTPNNTSDSTEEHQAGDIYLAVNSEAAWTIQVQELH